MVKWIVSDLLLDHCVVQEAPFGMKLLTNLDDCTGVLFPGLGQFSLAAGQEHTCVD